METTTVTERYSRQADLVPMDRLEHRKVTVIGVGAIGRQVALQCAAIGVQHLQLIDHDKVEISNVTSQGYRESDIGIEKVIATHNCCKAINKEMTIDISPRKFDDTVMFGETIFCCVDDIETRGEIFKTVGVVPVFFCDGRMAAESLRIVTVYDEASRKHYPTTLFTKEEAYEGSCTAKSTIYCANVIAGMMVAQFAKSLRGIPIEADISFNLQTNELSILKE